MKFYHGGDNLRVHGGLASGKKNKNSEYRSPFHEDVARLVHSPSFRRLSRKRQLLPSENSDFVRTRLTHSSEVAQVATSIGAHLNNTLPGRASGVTRIDPDLLMFAGLAHDIGHPPFGHLGEEVLNEKMFDAGGFEGNAQTLRTICNLEKRVSASRERAKRSMVDLKEFNDGINPTLRAVASVLKYDKLIDVRSPSFNNIGAKPKVDKGFYKTEQEIVEYVRRNVIGAQKHSTLLTIEAQIMDFADDIAYSIYDFEDCMKTGVLTPSDILTIRDVMLEKFAEEISDQIREDLESEKVIFQGLENLRDLKKPLDASLIREVIEEFLHPIALTPEGEKRYKSEGTLREYARFSKLSSSLTNNGKARRKFTETHIQNLSRTLWLDFE